MNSYFWVYLCSLRAAGGKLKLLPIHSSKVILIMNPAIKLRFPLRGAISTTNSLCCGDSEGLGSLSTAGAAELNRHVVFLANAGQCQPLKGQAGAGSSLQELRALCSDRQRQAQDSILKLRNTECVHTWWELPRKAIVFLIGRQPSRTILCWVSLFQALLTFSSLLSSSC